MKKCSMFCLGLALLTYLGITTSSAQSCGCDYTIGVAPLARQGTNPTFNGSVVGPGKVVCLTGSDNLETRFVNFRGDSLNPIVFRNCGKYTLTLPSNASYAMKFDSCRYFKLTGTGDASFEKGIEIVGGNIGLSLENFSSNFELDHLDVHGQGFAGIMAKTDPVCNDPKTWQGAFTMYAISIHDNYIHSTGGEGFYIGNSYYGTGDPNNCNKLPHAIVGAKVYSNKTFDTGREGIQVGAVTDGCEIHHNTIEKYGQVIGQYQNNGLQIGQGTGGLCYNNWIKNEPPSGQVTESSIICLGRGGNVIFNNILIDASGTGIYINEKLPATLTGPGSGFKAFNNTIINAQSDGIRLDPTDVDTNYVKNNIIIISNPGTYKYINRFYSNVKLDSSNNFNRSTSNISSAKFVNSSTGDYHLQSSSPAVNAGTNMVASYGVTFDYDDTQRPQQSLDDIGSYEYISLSMNSFINAGGIQVVKNDTTWEADQPHPDLDPSYLNYWTGSTNAFTNRVNHTIAPAQVLGSYRYTNKTVTNSNTIQYNIPVPVSGANYNVELFFAFKNGEYTNYTSGDRRFNIYAEDQFIATYDVFDSAGNGASSYSFVTTVNDNSLKLTFIAASGAEAQVNAIYVKGPVQTSPLIAARQASPQQTTTTEIVAKSDDLTISPNPAKDKITVRSSHEIGLITMLSLSGNPVHAPVNGNEVDVSGLPIGIYLIKIYHNGSMSTFRIIKH